MPHDTQTPLVEIVQAIGRDGFARQVSVSLRGHFGFDASTAFVHRPARVDCLFGDFAEAAAGIANYVRHTHRYNPMIGGGGGAFRARDFAVACGKIPFSPYVTRAPEEELGFLTQGWPRRLEEVGLYFQACGGVVELSFYRRRGRAAFSGMDRLEQLRAPIAAAFQRHGELTMELPDSLSPREKQVMRLLLEGCDSGAIALRLGLSRHTVKDHRKNIFRKLRLASLAELFARFGRHPS